MSLSCFEYEYRLPSDHPIRREDHLINDDLQEIRAALRHLIDEFRVKYSGFMPAGLPLAELLALIPAGGALVAPFFTSQGSAIFVVPGGVQAVTAEHVIRLDDFTLADLGAITRSTEDDPGWLRHYIAYRSGQVKARAWFDGIDAVTQRLWDALVEPIYNCLESLGIAKQQRVLIMPQSDTNLLPLHAVWREVEGVKRYFMDDYLITYTPSMVALANAQHRSKTGQDALVAGVSEYKTMNNLPNTRAEAQSIAALFGVEPLLDAAASVAAVKAGVVDKANVHLSCHGGFGWGGNALASSLYLGDDEPLSLPEIMANLDLKTARLVVLSACETGIVDFQNVPDEFLGLPAGFMQAGAAAVVSSLWTVEDRSTALLMERMYKLIHNETNPLDPAQALREAQFWLRNATAQEIGDYYQAHLVPRMSQSEAASAFIEVMQRAKPDEKPYAHSYFWAAFTYSGL